MDKKKVVINIVVGLITQIGILILSLFTKRKLIDVIGIDASGLIALFNSIFTVISVLELGIGSAITFCMYKPIIENNTKKISALYFLYRKIYIFIAIGVLTLSLCLTPLIPFLAKGYSLSFNIYLAYIIYMVCSTLSFFYSAKLALINAYKKNYAVNIVKFISIVTRCIIQIILLLFIDSLYIYISIIALSEIITNVLLTIIVNKNYKEIISEKNEVNDETKKDVVKLTKSILIHKFSYLVVNTADSIIISAFISVEVLGTYSNYIVIITSIISLAQSMFVSLSSIIGYAYLQSNKVIC